MIKIKTKSCCHCPQRKRKISPEQKLGIRIWLSSQQHGGE
jgi:hypothetical protein